MDGPLLSAACRGLKQPTSPTELTATMYAYSVYTLLFTITDMTRCCPPLAASRFTVVVDGCPYISLLVTICSDVSGLMDTYI
jgi:hypothetical protein